MAAGGTPPEPAARGSRLPMRVKRAPSNILVVHPGHLGDVVLGTPMLDVLRGRFPACRITVLVTTAVAPILAGHPSIDEVWSDGGGPRAFPRLAARIRRCRFDTGIGVHRSLRAASLLAAAGVPTRIGFRQSEGWFLYHHTVERDDARHVVERQLSLLGALGIAADGAARPSLRVAPEARRGLAACLRQVGADPTPPFTVIAPAAAWRAKEWPAEGYAAVARALHQRGERVLFVGAPHEAERVERVRDLAGCGVSLAGRTDAATLAAALESAGAVVCNDGAVLHVAQALAVPVVALFGPTSQCLGFAPRRPPAVAIEDEIECRERCRYGGTACPFGTYACFSGIDAGRVLDALAAVRPARRGDVTAATQAAGGCS